MELSDHDRRVLAELERQLATGDSRRGATIRRRLGVVAAVVGVVLVIVGLLLGVASGFLVGALLSASWIVRPVRRRLWGAEERADGG
jgi:Flp pilus assembly protein TadB